MTDFKAYLDNLERREVKLTRLINQETKLAQIKNIKANKHFLNGLIEMEKYHRLSKLDEEKAISSYTEIIPDPARSVKAMNASNTSQCGKIIFSFENNYIKVRFKDIYEGGCN